MTDLPLVSVIIPTYERATLVERALRSVLSQSVRDLEILVVDDASRDDTAGVVARYAAHGVKYLRHAENLGSAAARNTGFHASQGQYIAFLDSDDEWLPDKLEAQLAVFRQTTDERLAMVNCGLLAVRDGEPNAQLWTPSARGEAFWTFLMRSEYHDTASMWLMRRSALAELEGPFDTRLRYLQVSDLLVRLSQHHTCDFVSLPLAIYHDHAMEPRNERYPIRMRHDAYRIYLEKYRTYFAQRPDANARVLAMCATRCLAEGLIPEARRGLIEAISRRPFQFRSWLLLGISFLDPGVYKAARQVKRRVTQGRREHHSLMVRLPLTGREEQ